MMDGRKIGLVALLAIAAIAVFWYRSGVYANRDAPRARTGPPPKLVLVTGGSGPYWQAMVSGAEQAAKDQGAELQVMMPEGEENVAQQTELITKINAKEIDGLAVSPLDADKQTRLIDHFGKHALVVTVDSDAPFSQRLNYVGAANKAAGSDIGHVLQETLPEGGKVLVLMANTTKQNVVDRLAGLESVIGEQNPDSKFRIIDYVIDEGDSQRCKTQLIQSLDAHQDISVIVALNGYQGEIVADVLNEKGLNGKVTVVSFDVNERILDALQNGTITATIAQDSYQYGYEAISSLCSFCYRGANQLPLPSAYATTNIATKVVREKDVPEYRKQVERHSGDAPSSATTSPPKPASTTKKSVKEPAEIKSPVEGSAEPVAAD